MIRTRSARLLTLAMAAIFAVAFATEASAQGTGTGLVGEYYDQLGFAGAPILRTDATINFAAFPVPPVAGMTDGETYSVRWIGAVEAPATGVITFYLRTDDGGRLWVDGRLVIDQWRLQGVPGPPGPSGTISLTQNQKYSIRVEMYENLIGDGAILEWSYAGQAQIVVPQTRLYPEVPPVKPSLASGAVTNSFALSLVGDIPGTQITYTLNGGGSTPYTGPIAIAADATVVANATRANLAAMPAAVTRVYTVADTTPPAFARIESLSNTELYVVFSEPLATAPAQTAGNYTITPAIAVSAATLMWDLQTVRLTTAALAPGTAYVLSVNNLTDRAAPANTVAANTARAFTHRAPALANLVDWYRFDENGGTTAADSSGSATGGNAGTLRE